MSGQKAIDKGLQDVADKILAELPQELAAATNFSVDEKGERLLLDFAVQLDKTDYPMVIAIIKKFSGDFGNRKEGGKDIGYFFVPKLKPTVVTLVKTENPTVETLVETEQPTGVRIPSPASSTSPAEQKTASEEKKDQQLKVSDKVKQPSPISQFTNNYCSVCEDLGDKCNTTTASGREYRMHCYEPLILQVFQNLSREIADLAKGVILVLENLSKIIDEKAQSIPSVSPPLSQPKSEKVYRDTRPTEGHREEGIVWVNDVNAIGEAIEKAFEKDNSQSAHYSELRAQLVKKVEAGKKGLEANGKWYWLYQDKKTIGRKRAKEFAKGGRR